MLSVENKGEKKLMKTAWLPLLLFHIYIYVHSISILDTYIHFFLKKKKSKVGLTQHLRHDKNIKL